jgi:hypothetical protein
MAYYIRPPMYPEELFSLTPAEIFCFIHRQKRRYGPDWINLSPQLRYSYTTVLVLLATIDQPPGAALRPVYGPLRGPPALVGADYSKAFLLIATCELYRILRYIRWFLRNCRLDRPRRSCATMVAQYKLTHPKARRN